MSSPDHRPSAELRRRAVFLDFDGTYARGGVVPHEHDAAVRRARSGGHAVLLCTGRASSMLSPEVLDGLDGTISSAGAHVRIGDRLLCDVRFPPALGRRAVAVLEEHDAAFALEAPEALYCAPETFAHLSRRWQAANPPPGIGRGPADLARGVVTDADLSRCSFAKITVWRSPIPLEELATMIGPEIGALPSSLDLEGSGSGELHLRSVDKADGMRRAAEHLGIAMADTIGIGDGMNDLGMLRAAGTGIAIAGSPAEVQRAADMLAPPPEELGIRSVLDRLGLL